MSIDWKSEYQAEHEKRLADMDRIAHLKAACGSIQPSCGPGAYNILQTENSVDNSHMQDWVNGQPLPNQAQIDAEDAAQYRWLLDHCQTTGHLWNLLARGDKGTIKDFKTMVARCMASEQAAYERGRASTRTSTGDT